MEKEPSLTETYFIYVFIGGLQGELRNFVQMLKPETLDEVIALARLQEGGFNNLLAKVRSAQSTKAAPHPTSNSNTSHKSYSPITASYITSSKPTPYSNNSQMNPKSDSKAYSTPPMLY